VWHPGAPQRSGAPQHPGAQLPIISSRRTFIYTLGAGATFSLLIEVVQYFIGRSADVDDLMLNTAGSWLGFLLFFIIVKPFMGERSRSQ
jgi:glycopeptide antibiotics resistance protein